jgi:hypothetical protein
MKKLEQLAESVVKTDKRLNDAGSPHGWFRRGAAFGKIDRGGPQGTDGLAAGLKSEGRAFAERLESCRQSVIIYNYSLFF